MWRRYNASLSLTCSLILLTACSKAELDRDTATKLIGSRAVRRVQGEIPRLGSTPAQANAYEQLHAAGVLDCKMSGGWASVGLVPCNVGPRGRNLVLFNMGEQTMHFIAGQLVASEVTGVSQTGETTAVADVRLTFQPNSEYAQHEAQLLLLEDTGAVSAAKSGRLTARANFQRFDDGWRLESIQ
jgi:hypothetical protein